VEKSNSAVLAYGGKGRRMPETIKRNAEAQNLCRKANERVADVYYKFAASGALDMSTELFELFCECGQRLPCGERVRVTATTYERVRADPTLFILHPGHEATTVEYTIGRGEGFLITRNIGSAAEIARAGDPRTAWSPAESRNRVVL
jgi:hypothetical protein